MASNTPNLNLLKKDPVTDRDDAFNIQTMLNDNWDKIDAAMGQVDIPDASLTVKGKVQLSSAMDSDAENRAATPKAVKNVAKQLADLVDYLGYMPINGGKFDGNEPIGPTIDGGTY